MRGFRGSRAVFVISWMTAKSLCCGRSAAETGTMRSSWIRRLTAGGRAGELWKIEDSLYSFVQLCAQVLAEDPLFMLINSYTTGLQPMVLNNILTLCLKGYSGKIDAYEVGIATEEGIPLPCGAGGMFIHE